MVLQKINRFLFLGVIIIGLITISGCNSQKTYTDSEATQWLENYTKLTQDGKTSPSQLVQELDKNIPRIKDQKISSDAVNALLTKIYSYNKDFLDKSTGLTDAFKKYESDKIDFNQSQSLGKIDDSTLKSYLQDLQSKYYIVVNNQGDYEPHPNVQFFLDKYKNNMTPDLKELMEFTIDENTHPFYNKSASTFNLDLVRTRIVRIEKDIKAYPDSKYIKGLNDIKSYYYQVYFGFNSTFLMDKNKKVYDYVIKHYEETASQGNSQFSQDTAKVLDILKKSNNYLTANALAEMTEILSNEIPSQTSESSGNEQSSNSSATDSDQ